MADEATKLADVFSEDSLADIKKAWDETEPAPDYETTDGEPHIETDDNTQADDGPDDSLTISPAESDAAEKARLEHHTRIVEKNQQVAKAAARLELEKHRHKLAKEEYDGQVSELLDLIAEGPDYQQRLPLFDSTDDEPRAATNDGPDDGPEPEEEGDADEAGDEPTTLSICNGEIGDASNPIGGVLSSEALTDMAQDDSPADPQYTTDESQEEHADTTDIGTLDVSDKIKQALRLADINTINDLEIHAYNKGGKLSGIDGIGRAMRSQLEHALAEYKRGSKPYAGGELEA